MLTRNGCLKAEKLTNQGCKSQYKDFLIAGVITRVWIFFSFLWVMFILLFLEQIRNY